MPLSRTQANKAVVDLHRHHGPVAGFKFAVGLQDSLGNIVAVAIAGRPCRLLDNGRTLEVTRLATDGTANACSALYARCRRAAQALGYLRLVTYTLPDEGGASLRAAGFTCTSTSSGGGTWSRAGRPRADKHPLQPKWRWTLDIPNAYF